MLGGLRSLLVAVTTQYEPPDPIPGLWAARRAPVSCRTRLRRVESPAPASAVPVARCRSVATSSSISSWLMPRRACGSAADRCEAFPIHHGARHHVQCTLVDKLGCMRARIAVTRLPLQLYTGPLGFRCHGGALCFQRERGYVGSVLLLRMSTGLSCLSALLSWVSDHSCAHLEVVEVDELVRLRHGLGVLSLCGGVRQVLP